MHPRPKTNELLSEVRYMIWDYVFGAHTSNEGTTIDLGSDEVSSERATDCPVRPFAVDFAYNNLSILSACKSIQVEAKPVFWSKTPLVFRCTRDLHHFIKQRTIVPGRRSLTNLANIQHVRLVNDDINNVHHASRGRVLTRLANGDGVVSLAIQHGDKWPCWCERCLDVQEVFDVEGEEQWAERMAEEERMKELEEKHEGELEETLAENEEAIRGFEDIFGED
jgi:hypothetical protein